MRTRRFYLLLVGVLVTAGVLVAVLSGPREPEYGGRKLSEWVDTWAYSTNRDKCDDAIRHIGTNALPYLLKWIQDKPAWKSKLNRLTRRVFGRYDLGGGDRRFLRAEHAVEAFRALGPEARPAIPQLMRLMNDSNRRWSAERAGRAIVRMGTNARPALPNLVALLANTNGLAFFAMYAVGELQLEPQLVVPGLTNCLRSSNDTIRFWAAAALGQFGPEARGAVPALLNALGDSSTNVQHCAANALRVIDRKALEEAPNRAAGKNAE